MKITPATVIEVTASFREYSDNAIQYRLARHHNTMVDIDVAVGSGLTTTVGELIVANQQPLEFYDETLTQLARDHYVILETPKQRLEADYSDEHAIENVRFENDFGSGDSF